MTATDDDNRAPAGGRDVVDQLRSAGALDGLFEQIDSGQVSMTGADGLLGVFRTVLVLCFRLPSSGPGNRVQPRRECDTLGLSEDEYDCISVRSTRQYP